MYSRILGLPRDTDSISADFVTNHVVPVQPVSCRDGLEFSVGKVRTLACLPLWWY